MHLVRRRVLRRWDALGALLQGSVVGGRMGFGARFLHRQGCPSRAQEWAEEEKRAEVEQSEEGESFFESHGPITFSLSTGGLFEGWSRSCNGPVAPWPYTCGAWAL